MSILLIDNNDSFTYNIADRLRSLGNAVLQVRRSSQLKVSDLHEFDHVIISPGPMKPADFPVLKDVIAYCAASRKPLLGICLGHQAICEYFGGTLIPLQNVVHGHRKNISVDNKSLIFRNLPAEIEVGLYHSWTIEHLTLPDCLKITGILSDRYLMAVEHLQKPIYGVQFHPESFMTTCGSQIFENFLNIQT